MTIADATDARSARRRRTTTAPARGRTPRRASATSSREIAERRRADIREEMARLSLDDHLAIAGRDARRRGRSSTGSPRPGLHLIAEIKRSSPSAGRIAADRRGHRRPRPRLRGRRRGGDLASCASRTGSAARSTTCAPSGPPSASRSWPRSSSSRPIQLPHLRAAGADLVLLLAVLHPAKRARRSSSTGRSRSGWSRSSRPTTSASSSAALATSARADRHQQPRPADARRSTRSGPIRLRALVPDDRLVVAESGVRDAATIAGVAGRRLRCRARRRGARPRRPIRRPRLARFVAAGRPPADPANARGRRRS